MKENSYQKYLYTALSEVFLEPYQAPVMKCLRK